MRRLHRRLDKLEAADTDEGIRRIDVEITGPRPKIVVGGEVVEEIPPAPLAETEADRSDTTP